MHICVKISFSKLFFITFANVESSNKVRYAGEETDL